MQKSWMLITLSVGVLFLSGCSEKREKPLYELTLSDTALNGITKKTPFSYQALAPLLIGFDIKTYKTVSMTNSEIFRLYYNDVEWLQIEPTSDKKRIKSLYIMNKNILHKCQIGSDNKCTNTERLHYYYDASHRLEGIELLLNR